MSIADPNKTILTGENPFIRLSPKDGEPNSTEASYWRIIFCQPARPMLYLKSELTERRWRIYSDNIAMARWLHQPCKVCSMPNFPTQLSPVRTRSSLKPEIRATSGRTHQVHGEETHLPGSYR